MLKVSLKSEEIKYNSLPSFALVDATSEDTKKNMANRPRISIAIFEPILQWQTTTDLLQ